MILMHAGVERPAPKRTSPKLVHITTLVHQNVTDRQRKSAKVASADLNCGNIRKIQKAVLHICDSEIVDRDGIN